ncbi:LLM class flavin-dependent oxidoreductase [Amorphus sp. MBR-141]
MTLRYGVSFDGFVSTAQALATAQKAMATGIDSLWMAEHLGYREAMVTSMGFRMQSGDALVVPTAVSPYLWHPTPTAMALATLAEVGTAPVGIAVGVGNPLFLAESGQKIDKPVRAVREFIECLKALWTGEGVTYDGEFFPLAGARLGFTPPQPLVTYIAATGEQMLRLSGRIADGVVLSAGLSPVFCSASFDHVAEGAAKAGRDPDAIRRAAYLIFALSEDEKTARDLVRGKLAFLFRNKMLATNIETTGVAVDQEQIIAAISRRDLAGATALISDEAIDAFAVAGTPGQCHARLDAFEASGITEPVLMVQGDEAEQQLALAFLRDRVGRTRS